MAVLIDYDLKTINPNENDAITILKKIKTLEHNTEVVFYSHHDSVEVAIATIKHGAFDYIVVNDNQFLRLENELSAINDFLFHKTESKKYKKLFWLVLVLGMIWAIVILILIALGVIKAGNGVWVEA
jgi:DNA-binding NtrC family response regulator